MSNESIILGGRGVWRGVEGRGESVHLHLPIEGGGGEGSDVGRKRRRRLKTAKFPSPVSALPNLCLASIPFIIKKTEGDGSGTKRSDGRRQQRTRGSHHLICRETQKRTK